MFINYIIELFELENYNAIYVCIDKFTKMIHFYFIIINIIIKKMIKLYLYYIFKHYDLSHDVVFD